MNIKNNKKRTTFRVVIVLFAVLIAAACAFFFIPRSLVPSNYSEVTCSVLADRYEQIIPTDDQTRQLAEIMQKYKITPTLKQYWDISLMYEFRVVLMFHGVPGKKSSQVSGVTVYITEDGQYLYIAQKTGFPRGTAYKLHNGQQFYEELKTVIEEWK